MQNSPTTRQVVISSTGAHLNYTVTLERDLIQVGIASGGNGGWGAH